MLSLFKSKPKLAELIPPGYVDIHSHILPGIDDGASTLEDTKFLLEEMRQLGFTKVITTPHTMNNVWDNTTETITMALNEVNAVLTLPFALKAASEYALDESVIQKANNKTLLTIKENYLLVELSYLNAPIQLYDFLYELQLAGYQIVLAHPERYLYWGNDREAFERLKTFDLHFQLNTLSLLGYYGSDVKKLALELLDLSFYDFLGTDTHKIEHLNYTNNNNLELKNNSISELKKLVEANQKFAIISK